MSTPSDTISISQSTTYAAEQLRDMNVLFSKLSLNLRAFTNQSDNTYTDFSQDDIGQYMMSLQLADLKASIDSLGKVYDSLNTRNTLITDTLNTEKTLNIVMACVIALISVCFALLYYSRIEGGWRFWQLGFYNHDGWSIAIYSTVLSIFIMAEIYISQSIEILKKRQASDDMRSYDNGSLYTLNGYLYKFSKNADPIPNIGLNLYNLARITRKPQYDVDPAARTENGKILYNYISLKDPKTGNYQCGWNDLHNFMSTYKTKYLDSTSTAPLFNSFSDTAIIKNYFDGLDSFMNKQYQGYKYKDLTNVKAAILYQYLTSEIPSHTVSNLPSNYTPYTPIKLDDNSTALQTQMYKFKNSILNDVITNKTMLSIQQQKVLYNQLVKDLKSILGDTMMQYSSESITQMLQKIISNDSAISNPRRIVSNIGVLLSFIYTDIRTQNALAGIVPVGTGMSVSYDVFSRMVDDMNADDIQLMINNSNSVLENVTRAVSKTQESTALLNLATAQHDMLYTGTYWSSVLIMGICLVVYLYKWYKEDLFIETDKQKALNDEITRQKNVAADKKKKDDEKRKQAEQMYIEKQQKVIEQQTNRFTTELQYNLPGLIEESARLDKRKTDLENKLFKIESDISMKNAELATEKNPIKLQQLKSELSELNTNRQKIKKEIEETSDKIKRKEYEFEQRKKQQNNALIKLNEINVGTEKTSNSGNGNKGEGYKILKNIKEWNEFNNEVKAFKKANDDFKKLNLSTNISDKDKNDKKLETLKKHHGALRQFLDNNKDINDKDKEHVKAAFDDMTEERINNPIKTITTVFTNFGKYNQGAKKYNNSNKAKNKKK